MYFKNLDGLRFIAAIFVIIGHCQSILYNQFHIRTYSPWGEKMANFGVDFFFVLSGFLISFLLLQELKTSGTIKIRNFYIRRGLRLWPLYFLVGIFALLTAEPILTWMGIVDRSPLGIEWFANFLYLGLFSINFQILFGHTNEFSSPTLGHFWSLSVEEQFYLFWAPALLLFKRIPLWFILSMIVLGAIFTLTKFHFYDYCFAKNAWASSSYFTLCRFYHFGLGALIAFVVLNKDVIIGSIYGVLNNKNLDNYLTTSVLNIVKNKYFIYLLQLSFLYPMSYYLFGHHYYTDSEERILNGFLSVGIIFTAIIPHSVFLFEFRLLKYFGKISFGIYIFHLFAIHVILKLLLDAGFVVEDVFFQLLFPLLAAILATGIATLSFETIEKPILKLKKKLK
jgi:peptidoglycan/LPS O-acetylase OafA/YrhL